MHETLPEKGTYPWHVLKFDRDINSYISIGVSRQQKEEAKPIHTNVISWMIRNLLSYIWYMIIELKSAYILSNLILKQGLIHNTHVYVVMYIPFFFDKEIVIFF